MALPSSGKKPSMNATALSSPAICSAAPLTT